MPDMLRFGLLDIPHQAVDTPVNIQEQIVKDIQYILLDSLAYYNWFPLVLLVPHIMQWLQMMHLLSLYLPMH